MKENTVIFPENKVQQKVRPKVLFLLGGYKTQPTNQTKKQNNTLHGIVLPKNVCGLLKKSIVQLKKIYRCLQN